MSRRSHTQKKIRFKISCDVDRGRIPFKGVGGGHFSHNIITTGCTLNKRTRTPYDWKKASKSIYGKKEIKPKFPLQIIHTLSSHQSSPNANYVFEKVISKIWPNIVDFFLRSDSHIILYVYIISITLKDQGPICD